MRQPSVPLYPSAGSESPVTWHDLVGILDTHGLRLMPGRAVGRGVEAKEVRAIFKAWVKAEGIRSDLPYVMPLRILVETILRQHPELVRSARGVSWAVVVDAINDPRSGLTIVRRRFANRAA